MQAEFPVVPHSELLTTDFEQWHDAMSVLYQPDLLDTGARDDPFQVRVENFMLGLGTIGRCASVRQAFRRSKTQIGQDGIQNYMIQIFRKGRCLAHAPRGDVILNTGDICIFDNAEPLDTVNEDFDLMALVVPRDLLAPLLHDPDGLHYGRVRRDTPLARLFSAHVMDLYQMAPKMRAQEGPGVFSAMVHYLAAVINGGVDLTVEQKVLLRRGILQEIQRYIDSNVEDPDLTVERIAARFGISRTRLYGYFEAYGGVAAFVQQRRLAIAFQKLTHPMEPRNSINAIAASVGFQSESAFIRAFRRQYEKTPGEARREGMKTRLIWTPAQSNDRQWSDWIAAL